MTGFALTLVLVAAGLHAGWNALLKAVDDRAAVLGAVSTAHVIAGLALIFLVPGPSVASWPAILISTLVHYGYYLLLFHAYRHGDLSQVYPISRGLAPALVSLSAVMLIGENLAPLGWAGLALVSCGIGLLALQRGAVHARPSTIGLAVALGFLIATYSFADGVGVRRSGSTLGYMGWLFLFEAPVPLTVALLRLKSRGTVQLRVLLAGLAGGACAVTAYGLVLYVKTFAPLGAVSAIRESSVVIGTLIGIAVFGERPWRGRLFAAAVVAAGIVALALSGR